MLLEKSQVLRVTFQAICIMLMPKFRGYIHDQNSQLNAEIHSAHNKENLIVLLSSKELKGTGHLFYKNAQTNFISAHIYNINHCQYPKIKSYSKNFINNSYLNTKE